MITEPIPARMKHLKIDKRGYPIPWGVYIDLDGLPHFAVNTEHIRHRCLIDDLCSICGGKLWRGRWFVGGALSAFHEYGAFIDPPMHNECAHYALKVCPYLAAPSWGKEIGVNKVMQSNHDLMVIVDRSAMPGRPHREMFIALMATRQKVFDNFNCKPIMPYRTVEYWRRGEQIPDQDGKALVKQAIQEFNEKEWSDE